jgi:hypothetical protein
LVLYFLQLYGQDKDLFIKKTNCGQDKSFRMFNLEISFHLLLTRPNTESIDDDQPRIEKLSLKKKGIGSEARAERIANTDSDLQLMGEAERGRQLQKQKKRRIQGREDEVSYELVVLICFISLISSYFLGSSLLAKALQQVVHLWTIEICN